MKLTLTPAENKAATKTETAKPLRVMTSYRRVPPGPVRTQRRVVRRKRRNVHSCIIAAYWLVAAQIIGATGAYYLFDHTHKDIWPAVAIASIFGSIGPVKHLLELSLNRWVNRLPKCKDKPCPRFVATMMASFLGVCLFCLVHSQFA